MPALHDIQSAMASAIRHGPDHVPVGVFAGEARRVLLGFKVHANTISHGRLVALEESFPRLIGLVGQDAFNALAREFIEAGHGCAEPLAHIGNGFPEWLDDKCATEAALIARFDRAWLESFHAAEAAALDLPTIAALDEPGLLSLGIMPHPAARLAFANAALRGLLTLDDPAPALLVLRPAAEIRILPLCPADHALFKLAGPGSSIGLLFERLGDDHQAPAILAAASKLIGAGAFCRTEVPS